MSIPHESRYERKFVIGDRSRAEVEHIVRLHPALFRRIYHRRHINNIYFDTLSMQHYRDGVEGSSSRMKLRIRWYGDLFGEVEHPALELKSKREMLVGKQSFPLTEFVLEPGADLRHVLESLQSAELPAHVRRYIERSRPVLLNRYSRNYFLSADAAFRITIDSDLRWYAARPRTNSFLNRTVDDRTVILELKYAEEHAAVVDRVSALFPFRMERCSKYTSGIEWTTWLRDAA